MWQVRRITFEEILPVWRDQLWPNRESPIEPLSAIDEDGSINMKLMLSHPYFLGAYLDDQIIGVLSGFKTSAKSFRSRGLWVAPEQRGLGLARKLMADLERLAREAECDNLWTMARQDAWLFYRRLGFQQKLTIERYEYGPHVICAKALSANLNG